jgi:1-acyl-sn-glycerol-3-phosphate acyltransferase
MRHLRGGQVVGIFPEGEVRQGGTSVLAGGTIHDGVCKLAQLAGVPVLPCVVLGGEKFSRWTCWLPGARTRWVVAYGEAIFPHQAPDRRKESSAMADELAASLRALQTEVADYV